MLFVINRIFVTRLRKILNEIAHCNQNTFDKNLHGCFHCFFSFFFIFNLYL